MCVSGPIYGYARGDHLACFANNMIMSLTNQILKRPNECRRAQKEKRRKQNKEMFHYRDLLRKHCKRKELYSLLNHNKKGVPEGQPKGQEEALDRLCDMMTFGALAPCEECNGGPLVYRSWLQMPQ